MRVDGLTNDEVKSHLQVSSYCSISPYCLLMFDLRLTHGCLLLQKYRLHTQRVPVAKAANSNRSAVALGGLWMHNESLKGGSSGSPQGPLQLATQSGEATSRTEGDNMIDDDVKSDL